MDKKIDHKLIEKNRNQKWIDKKFFSEHDNRKKPFTIILPPPNVTGKLHLGHAWDGFIQDVIIRYKKLKGYDVLFLPAVDHAGIATQTKVEERLRKDGISRHDLGREKFLEKVWEWKDEYYQIIKKQWATLGLALDYSNERFTLDKEANEAVLKVFVDFYNKGLIYKGLKAITWDPKQKTALSNIEVINKPTEQKMYYIKYPFENSNEYLTVATTRIETIASDVAVAVHPSDKRYSHLVSKNIVHPFTKKKIPVITDNYIDKSFGSGVMKVSAHATEDIEIINRNGLEIIESINADGTMNENALEFKGLDRFTTRQKMFEKLQKEGYILKTETITSNVGYSERSGEVVEILMSEQWFVKMDHLANNLLDHLKSKDAVQFFPKRFRNVIRRWIENVYDWTISRQLWWGHRIPAWYKDGQMKVQIESPGEGWVQDEDVLDTWFSSGLSPFVFLGWPQSDQKLKRYYPTSLLVTGWDIIFFWVARMYFFGLETLGQKPFKQVLLHGLIRDENGLKMSKSLGNGIDPMEVIEQYGSDVLREALIFNSTPGQDIKFSEEKLRASWSLNNKLWNIIKYINDLPDTEPKPASDREKWIWNKLYWLNKNINKYMKKYEFTLIYKEIQKFIFDDFSSWYIELSKTEPNKQQALLLIKKLLIILHPFIPFLSDYLYEELFNEELLDSKRFVLKQYTETKYIDDVIEIVKNLRQYREKFNISKKEKLQYFVKNSQLDQRAIDIINNMCNAEVFANEVSLLKTDNFEIYINLSQQFLDQEQQKIKEEIAKIEFEIKRAKGILENKKFLEKAPEAKVKEEQDKLKNYQEKLKMYLDKLNN
ncbi:valine--tRNA ligase [Mycoplasma procyoni]|uniref:valine--tRNA ligase n=1 Tax=Mycoplasma procyoni TaxID=568784 RepID=UPI00197B305C|nr:valine--tRNA ligase [Mycoplasma procyoni]MBN3535059.1 valine--tRNA ligase [Mycoplasma procyoni]